MREKYIGKLIEYAGRAGLDGVLISPGEEMEFLTGFRPMMCERFQGLFVKKNGEMFYICNLLYKDQVEEAFPESVHVYSWFDGDIMTEIVSSVLEKEGMTGSRIGVNSDAQAFNILEIMDKVNVTFVNAKPLLEEIRIIKDHEELENLRKSSAIVDQVFGEVQKIIRTGISEAAIQEFLLTRMSELGGKSPECIVGVRINASYPHYVGNQGIVGEKDLVLMDYGCTYNGLYSDMTRTVFVGEPDARLREAYDLVKKANEEAEKLVKEGAWIPDIDKKAREILDEKGYAETLVNRLGHGVGYTIHEAPDIKQSDRRKLERGMAFSIEPGIYIGGDFGIRIEDVVIVNESGEREILNRSSKELIIL